jgi:hypothetical protein
MTLKMPAIITFTRADVIIPFGGFLGNFKKTMSGQEN